MKNSVKIMLLVAAMSSPIACQLLVKAPQAHLIAEDSPAKSYGVSEPTYSRLATAALNGDCEAAYKLGRHHTFFSLNSQEAIRWYRLAAKCPHANAKGELIGILMHFEAEDAEVDRLLSELELLDPKSAEGDREAVRSVRSLRK